MESAKTDIPPKALKRSSADLTEKRPAPTARLTGIQFGLLSIKEADQLSVLGTKSRQTGDLKEGVTKWQDLFDDRLGIPNKEQKCGTCAGITRGGCDRPRSCDGHFGHISLPLPIFHPHFMRRCVKILSSICLGCSRVLAKKKRKNVLDEIFEVEPSGEQERENSASGRAARKRKEGSSGVGTKRKRIEKASDMPSLQQFLMQDLGSQPLKQEVVDTYRFDFHEFTNRGFPQARQCKEEFAEFSDTIFPSKVPEMPSDALKSEDCKRCGAPGSEGGSKLPKVKLKVVGKLLGRRGRVETVKLVVDEKAGELPSGYWDFVNGHPTNFKDKTRTLLPAEALSILRRIPEDDIAKLHMHKVVSRPDAFILKQILVSPNCNRLIMEDWSCTVQPKVLMRRGRQNAKLEALVKKVKQIKEASSGRIEFADAEQDCEDLQLHAARHFRSCKVVEYKMATGQEIEETGGSLEHKWLKANVLAKRSNQSARTVVNGDPCIMIGEIGIPREMAQRLTVDEKVNKLNIKRWQRFVHEYMVTDEKAMPGAFLLKKRREVHQRDLEILRARMRGKDTQSSGIKLEVGDTITRCLKDGDHVLANRPPSLHKHSLIALKVKVHPCLTFAINPLICSPFDADFDGDAFHIFVPQSLESMAELKELTSVTQQIICPQGGQPLIGLSQDTLVGGHLLTNTDVFINREDMTQLSMWCSSKMPVPAIVKSPDKTGPLWTGKQLFSMTLPGGLDFGHISWTGNLPSLTVPYGLNYSSDGEVLIRDGEVLIWQRGAKWLERSPNGIVRAIHDHAGPGVTMEHLDCIQAVLNQWLLIRGFSVGLFDFYAASDVKLRNRMLEGVQKSLQRANEASLKQALKLDRLLQHRILSPRQDANMDSIDLEHQGCFGLLLGEAKSSQRVTALQGVAVEKFQSLAPIIENLVTGYMDKNNSLLAMVWSGSKGSISKLTQQAGCLGLQLYKGESMLRLRFSNKLSYFHTFLEKGKSEVFYQTKSAARHSGYWESRGIIASSYLDGLNPLEFFIDTISSRGNLQRQGIEEPNQILKGLMLFMRDIHIAYDGTVRNCSGQRIIQFQYGGVKESAQGEDSNPIAPENGYSKSTHIGKDSAEGLEGLRLAGEPVGALAATSIAEPAYNVKMQSIHQSQLLGSGPVQLLKEILIPRYSAKLKFNDRRSLLRLHQGFGKERRALDIQNELQKVTLEMITLISAIEFVKLDDKLYVRPEDGKEGSSPKILKRISPWIGHLVLCKRTVEKTKLSIDSIVELLKQKHSGKIMEDSFDIYFLYSERCKSKVHPQSTCLCIWFFPVVPRENLAAATKEVHHEKMALVLESMKSLILPEVLNTTIKGCDGIERVRIIWEDIGSASRLPYLRTQPDQPSSFQTRRPDPGELVLEVVVKETKGAGKRGAAWLTVKEACIPVMDLIDWHRSSPYSIQEISQTYGLEAAYQNIIKRLTLVTKNMGKPVLPEHLILVADTMTHSGEVIGLGLAGYREFCHNLSISTPFTDAAFKEPKRIFLDAAARGVFDNIDGVLPSSVFGKRIPLGTGLEFKLTSQVPKATGQTWPADPLKLWDDLRVQAAVERKRKSSLTSSSKFFSFTRSTDTEMTGEAAMQSQDCRAVGAKFEKQSVSAFSFERSKSIDRKGNINCLGHNSLITKQSVNIIHGNSETYTTSPGATQGAGTPDKQTGRKRIMGSVKENDISDKRARKVHKQHENFGLPLVESDPAIVKFNDPRKVTWSMQSHSNTPVADELKANFPEESRDRSCRLAQPLPHIVCPDFLDLICQASPEIPTLKTHVEASHQDGAMAAMCSRASVCRTDSGSKKIADESPGSSTFRPWSEMFNYLRRIPSKLFTSSSKNSEDSHGVLSPEAEPLDARLAGGDLGKAGGVSTQPTGLLLDEDVADVKKELQNLLHVRYRPGERVQRDDEKMLLDEVLIHHPKRAEKVGCGVDYVKVDYHPCYPASKCFHVVRKDGSSSDFSYVKCLDNKLLRAMQSQANMSGKPLMTFCVS